MTGESLFLIIPFVLIICIVLYYKNQSLYHLTDLVMLMVGYLFFIVDFKKDTKGSVIFDQTWNELSTAIIYFSIIVSLITIVFNNIIKKKTSKLKESGEYEQQIRNIKKEYSKLCSDNIKIIFKSFFTNSSGAGRISIYKHLEDTFVLLGRYSNNPEYNKKGRDSYPNNKGFISNGWKEGYFTIHNIPKWVGNGKKYIEYVRNYCDIDEKTLRKIKMKSCSFYIKRIENEIGDSRLPLGIIVFEQLQNSEIDSRSINNKLKENKEQLTTLIKSMKTIY
ncbi:hypothetical protein [Capnocytophaga cynodegmi]|uniref:hypothetical protein n=1 Tax=Capnocytophaga cynodegmi TaxID=28189 RepID=UPI00385DC516